MTKLPNKKKNVLFQENLSLESSLVPKKRKETFRKYKRPFFRTFQGTLENLIIFEELGKSLLQPLKRNAHGVFIFFCANPKE